MAYDLSKDAPAPKPEAQVFKGYVATVTLHPDRAETKRKLMGRVSGAKDSVIPLGAVIKIQSKEPTRLVNGYVPMDGSVWVGLAGTLVGTTIGGGLRLSLSPG